MTRSPDVVIIGGGPVGLWVAIQTKKWQPDFRIRVYERSQNYVRTHLLRLDRLSTTLYANPRNDSHTRLFYDRVGHGNDLTIPTCDLEASLREYALNLGVEISYQKIDSPTEAMELHPACQFFVAADGSHSTMRKLLMGEDDVALDSQKLQYCVEMKYRAVGISRPLDLWTDQRKLNAKATYLVVEQVGREFDLKTPVTLRFFVDQATYEALPEASFKNPLDLGDDRIPGKLKADILRYLDLRRVKVKEVIRENSQKISKLTLSLYAAKKFCVEREGRFWFLAGDAAMGLPYFRSLNSGMLVGSQLAAILAQKLMSGPLKLAAYEVCKVPDTAVEFMVAGIKNAGISVLNRLRKLL